MPGPQGLQGPEGPQGIQGEPGASGGTVGPPGGTPYTVVASNGNLPAASGNEGKGYYVQATKTLWVSDNVTWRLEYGNTLTRNMAGYLDAGWKLHTTAGFFRMRRVGNMCYISGRLQRVTAGTTVTGVALFTPMSGFVPADGYTVFGVARHLAKNATGHVGNEFSSTRIDINFPVGGNYAVDDAVWFSAQWWTDHSWPTSLP